ncbi:lycopene cyclase family protein [Streptomyces sp. NBC_01803]|uniref:lycopene cyclase family protein n=1 Tax=Streptomyces sp. NBC_01803 TaxID=2975946 RepID=UPI002DD92C06|nr:lycopene cyclase family protein [Streptomyces sp. NBC_01803]WSA45542.1 lycopene cyclase family protein [Streptomyces sp. NBC_01803]
MGSGPVTGDADVVIVGAGAAGLSLAHRLPDTASVVLVDAPAGPLRPAERTWCFWEEERGEYDDAVAASWDRLRVRGTDGRAVEGRPGPLRYKMLRSTAFEALVTGWLGRRPGFGRVEAAVHSVRDAPGGGGAVVRGVAGDGRRIELRARWAFDSRPPRRLPPARTTLFQHFRGWFVRTERAAFDPDIADLMDFRTRQPGRGLSFGYVLPFGPCEALVEYTEFAPALLDHDGYERALRHFTRDVLGLRGPRVTAVEQGVIPMTDAVFPRRAGKSVFRIGTAGGATRPATGYTFAAVQRQTRTIAAAYRRGRPPVPPPAHPAKSRAMDAVLLRALATGRIDGAEFFTGLFRGVPTERLLRFLDGRSTLREDLAIGLRTPVRPMLRTVAELPVLSRKTGGGR